MIIFAGSRKRGTPLEKDVYYWSPNLKNVPRRVPLWLDQCNHSPTGFEWGYGGSGPAQLAWVLLFMSLVTVVTLKEAKAKADLYHQGYKWAVIAGLPYEGWQLSSKSILDWLQRQGYNPSTNLD